MAVAHQTIYLKDYTPPPFLCPQVEMTFDLAADCTTVTTQAEYVRNGGSADLHLYGEELELLEIALDGARLGSADYQVLADGLLIPAVPDRFTLRLVSRINPAQNSALEGLYLSSGNLCTQCEPEGFRRITYALDRPDVMSVYTVTLRAGRAEFPVLLANGNLVEHGDLAAGRHYTRWHDPFPKPSYLFAVVAGDLVRVEDYFTSASGREVLLQIYVQQRNRHKCAHAMAALKKAMAWDERRFGLEYDLDRYMIVAVDDFNMGAMENKGLNIFNSRYVLASSETATDADYLGIEGVIAHEYFHNWTGNRITCRDWFQLSLKEGLTVFRDQWFSAEMNSAAVQRIEDVRLLRTHQFAEDAGPLAHPVRPESYVEINNFYTATVYNKGAEVIRMLYTIMGEEAFLAGMRCYVERHDGQAVTCDDFIAAMQSVTAIDLSRFKRWYSQAGTPLVQVECRHDSASGELVLDCRQSCPPTPGQAEKQPLHIPLRVGIVAADGSSVPLRAAADDADAAVSETVLHLCEARQQFRFAAVPPGSVVSLLRGFSAPVKLEMAFTDPQLAFLMAADSDPFNRWDAAQQLAQRELLRLAGAVADGEELELADCYVDAFRRSLEDEHSDPALLALALTLPEETYLAQQQEVADPVAIHHARQFARRRIAALLHPALLACYRRNRVTEPYRPLPRQVGRRSLKNLCLSYLATRDETRALAHEQYRSATNMTDSCAALAVLADYADAASDAALEDFYQRWQHEPLVVDKWLAIQAQSARPDCLRRVEELEQSAAFDRRNPNKVRALIGTFCHGNPAAFHAADGSGYRFLRRHVAELDRSNPQIAARLVIPLLRWQRYDDQRAAAMRAELRKLLRQEGLSADVYEMVSKGLAAQ